MSTNIVDEAETAPRMSAALVPTVAWGGDAARKQASVAAARTALAAGPDVTYSASLKLSSTGQADDPSNVYCAAYGTADPLELETRAGLPASTLLLASAALGACEYWGWSSEGDGRVLRRAGVADDAPIAVLEAIRTGADPLALARHYVVDLLRALAAIRDRDGRGLTPDQQALVRKLATLHEEGCTDPAAFRAIRRTAMATTDAASGDVATTVLGFAETVAWPLPGLAGELPEFVMRVHFDLRLHLARERITAAEQATIDALSARYGVTHKRVDADPTLDVAAEFANVETSPEYAAVYAPAFVARLEHYERVAAEAYAPFAVDLLIGAFRKA